MGNTYKVVITGPFNVGKTEFVRSASDIPIVSTERRITDELRSAKDMTTVAMDYGHVKLGRDMFHLYGTPGQPRFDFMWEILAKEMDAFVVLVDSSNSETFLPAKQLVRAFRRLQRKGRGRTPCVVAANKQDVEGALPAPQVAKALGLEESIPVLPCVAQDRTSVLEVLRKVQDLLD